MRILRHLNENEIFDLVNLLKSDQEFWTLFKAEERRKLYPDVENGDSVETLSTVELVTNFLNDNKIDHAGWSKSPLVIELRGIARVEIKKEAGQ